MVSSFITKRVLALLLAATANTHQRTAETNLATEPARAAEAGILVGALAGGAGEIDLPIGDPIVRPLAVVATTVTFRQGSGGYAGAGDTYIDSAATATNNGAATSLTVDLAPSVKQALVRFNTLFVSEGGPIPDGATINAATLTINATNVTAQQVRLHRMLRTWAPANTWSTFGSSPWNAIPGIQLDGVEAVATADVSATFPALGPASINVTSSVQEWSTHSASRFGWVLNETVDDSLIFDSSEAATVANRPVLAVTYTACAVQADCNDGNPCTDDACTSGVCRNTVNDANSCADSIACTTEQCSGGACLRTCNCPGQACNYATGLCETPAPLPVAIGDSWRYFKGTTNPPGGWNNVCFDDSSWLTGAGGFGFGTDCNGAQQRNTTLSDMQSSPGTPGYQSLYMRRVFNVANAAAISGLTLSVDYDDGFVAYLNGTEIARSSTMGGAVGTQPAFNAAPSLRECSVCDGICSPAQSFPVSAALLVSGANVLAIQGHNNSLDSTDFTIAATLTTIAPPNLPPVQPTSPSPSNGATDVPANPPLCVNVSDPDGDPLTVTFKGRPATGVAAGDFTIIALPDTQFYAQRFPATFTAQTQWIRDNTASRNIVFVTQLGDCTNDGDSIPVQWTRADAAFDILELPMTGFPQGMPYGICVGNHDQTPAATARSGSNEIGTTTSFNQTFGRQRFCPQGVCRSYFGGNYTFGGVHPDAMDNHYELFSASGMDFIIFHLEWDNVDNPTRQAVLAWVDNLLTTTYSDRRAILTAHYFLNEDASFSSLGQATFNALRDRPNVFLMLCGHNDQACYRAELADDGHTVHAMMSDYQDSSNGGNGWLRILTFSPQNDSIHVETYSPIAEGGRFINKPTRHSDDNPNQPGGNELLLSYDMQSGRAFTTIGTNTGVESGTPTCVQWTGVTGQSLEWQVTVSDGRSTTTGPTWSFSSPCTSDAECNDNNACNGVETCQAAACVAGTAPNCDDGNPCTDDPCSPATGCVNASDDTNPCSDGNPCTVDTCVGGACISSGPSCDDGNPCTDDSCVSGSCIHTMDDTNPCSDGSGCTVDACVNGTCISTLNCDDGNACTDDSCVAGSCIHPVDDTNPCSDGNPCTVDTCAGGACISSGPSCDDGNPCTDDSCVGGSCVHTNDDSNTCSDGDACTAPDVCRAGACACGSVSVCTGTTASFAGSGPVTIPTGPAVVSSTVTVSGAGVYLQHLRVTTAIAHTNSADLDVTLTSPAGTVVTLTSDNGGTLDNVFNGTVWDDDANPSGQVPYTTNAGLATDHLYANNVVASSLVPEEALAAFDGENPNGVWTLRISDDTAVNGGTLSSWSLAVTALSAAPSKTTASVTNPTDVAVQDLGTVSSSIPVSGRTGKIGKVRVTTLLTHNGCGDIDMTLRSPAGTVVTLTTDNLLGLNNLFNGTVWDDDADPDGQVLFTTNTNSAGDHPYVDNTPVSTLTPEEALGAFKDEDPNGTWTLSISDDESGDGGLLGEWRLEITTVQCPAATCAISCDDSNPCTDDSCNPATGCVNTPNNANVCSDGNSCTVGTCVDGACISSGPNCDDGNPCTDDSCVGGSCVHPADNTNTCSDGNGCTVDACVNGACISTLSCDDGNACTDDSCVSGACIHPADNTNPCTDNNSCTVDSCVNGSCISSGPNCDDGNPCTDDSCVGGSCVHTNDDTNTCSDSNACTAPDVCRAGACVCGSVSVCNGTTASFAGSGPVTIPTGPAVISSTVTVSGAGAYLQHLRVTTAITHTNNADLDVTLTSPAGTVVTLTSDNGGTLDNVFNGTAWDDDANSAGQVPYVTNVGLATDHPYANNVVASSLVPEEAFAAFDGENPNGVWTLRVSDDTAANGGTLSSWSLAVTTLPSAPAKTTASITNPTDVTIVNLGTVSSNIAVSGRTGRIGKVRVTTLLTHQGCGDIDMTLRSPSGSVVTLTTDNLLGLNNLFNGTVWDDDADPDGQVPFTTNTNSVGDHPYVDNTPVLALTPEEALGAFKDEDPNGTWTLTISDDQTGDGGLLSEWRLEITTVQCPAATCSISCDDGNSCTDDSCNPTTGCANQPNGNCP